MQLLILASPFDRVADAIERRLAPNGVVRRCSLEELAAARWGHRLGATGTRTELVLADGAVGDGAVVLNRLRYEPTLLFTRMTVADRDYARAEFHALLLSWLASLGPRMIGRPAPSGLGGAMLGGWQWLTAARRAGFATYPAAATTSARRAPPPAGNAAWPALLPGADDPALDLIGFDRPRSCGPEPEAQCLLTVIGGMAVDTDDPALAIAACQLAEDIAADILQIELATMPGDPRWRFVSAASMPETLDPPAIDALAALIEARQ